MLDAGLLDGQLEGERKLRTVVWIRRMGNGNARCSPAVRGADARVETA
jgi:hypothetical protein